MPNVPWLNFQFSSNFARSRGQVLSPRWKTLVSFRSEITRIRPSRITSRFKVTAFQPRDSPPHLYLFFILSFEAAPEKQPREEEEEEGPVSRIDLRNGRVVAGLIESV